MTIKEIISKYLTDNGYEGLFNSDGECGCLLDDLCPCDGEIAECQPGYKLPGNEEYDFSIGAEKPDKKGEKDG
jgi:hypothetical protein